jgi:hypothetical protein
MATKQHERHDEAHTPPKRTRSLLSNEGGSPPPTSRCKARTARWCDRNQGTEGKGARSESPAPPPDAITQPGSAPDVAPALARRALARHGCRGPTPDVSCSGVMAPAARPGRHHVDQLQHLARQRRTALEPAQGFPPASWSTCTGEAQVAPGGHWALS